MPNQQLETRGTCKDHYFGGSFFLAARVPLGRSDYVPYPIIQHAAQFYYETTPREAKEFQRPPTSYTKINTDLPISMSNQSINFHAKLITSGIVGTQIPIFLLSLTSSPRQNQRQPAKLALTEEPPSYPHPNPI